MNAPANLAALKPANMTFLATGRIESASKFQDSVTTLIKTPAPDAYSYPSTIAVRSKSRLGTVGEEVTVTCRIGGVPRTFKRVDKETGEEVTVRTADAYFNVIE